MIGCAVARGLRLGWLDSSFLDVARRCWRGAAERIDDDGHVVDACASTGVQAGPQGLTWTVPPLPGSTSGAGGMALWFAVEMERLIVDTPC